MKFPKPRVTPAPYSKASLVVAAAAVASLAVPRPAAAQPTGNAEVERLLASAEIEIGNAVADLTNIEIQGQVQQADKLTQHALREVEHTIGMLDKAAHKPSPGSSPQHSGFAANGPAPPSAGAVQPATIQPASAAIVDTAASAGSTNQTGNTQIGGTHSPEAQSVQDQTARKQATEGQPISSSSGGASATPAGTTSTAPTGGGAGQTAAATSPVNNASGQPQPSGDTTAASPAATENSPGGQNAQPAGSTQSQDQATTQPGGTSGSPASSGGTASGTSNAGAAAAASSARPQTQAASTGAGASSSSANNSLAPEAARKYIGQSVQDADGQSLGSLQNITEGPDGQTIAVLAYGGFLGLFQSHAAIPWTQAKPHLNGPQLVFDMTPNEIQKAPRYASK